MNDTTNLGGKMEYKACRWMVTNICVTYLTVYIPYMDWPLLPAPLIAAEKFRWAHGFLLMSYQNEPPGYQKCSTVIRTSHPSLCQCFQNLDLEGFFAEHSEQPTIWNKSS